GAGREDSGCAGAIPRGTRPRAGYRLHRFSRRVVGWSGALWGRRRAAGVVPAALVLAGPGRARRPEPGHRVGSEAGALEALGRGGAVHRVQEADDLAVVGLVPGLLARADEVDVQRGLLVAGADEVLERRDALLPSGRLDRVVAGEVAVVHVELEEHLGVVLLRAVHLRDLGDLPFEVRGVHTGTDVSAGDLTTTGGDRGGHPDSTDDGQGGAGNTSSVHESPQSVTTGQSSRSPPANIRCGGGRGHTARRAELPM